MSKGRLEAFSDGVFAILITIMVLELHAPEGNTFELLKPVLPKFICYILSFAYIGIYWNNHHHIFQAAKHVNGKVLWAVKVSPSALKAGAHAGNIVRELAKITGGGGGGRPDFAQAGGKDVSKIDEALGQVPMLLDRKSVV